MKGRKKPLYRKVNTRTHHVNHKKADAKYGRNTKKGMRKSLDNDNYNGLDLTPLYKFLLSKVGCDWDGVYKEALSRLPEMIHKQLSSRKLLVKIVAINEESKYGYSGKLIDYICCGENSYFSKLFVDENNKIQILCPEVTIENIYPTCSCCTHTFNGKVLTNKFIYDHIGYQPKTNENV